MLIKCGDTCFLWEPTNACLSKNRYLMVVGRRMIKHHLHMELLTQGPSPERNESPLVSGRQYRGVARGQLRHCSGFSKCVSQDLPAFLQAWVFSLEHLWWNKVLLRLPCLSSWFCYMKTGKIKAAFYPTATLVLPAWKKPSLLSWDQKRIMSLDRKMASG